MEIHCPGFEGITKRNKYILLQEVRCASCSRATGSQLRQEDWPSRGRVVGGPQGNTTSYLLLRTRPTAEHTHTVYCYRTSVLLQDLLGGSCTRVAGSQCRLDYCVARRGRVGGGPHGRHSIEATTTFPGSQIIDLTRFQVSDDPGSYTKTFCVVSARMNFFEFSSSH